MNIFLFSPSIQTLGNHDFDYGILDLINFIQGINPSVVVSNINTSQEPLWPSDQKLIKRTKIIDVGGEKIGIVGYTVEETSRYWITWKMQI